MTALTQETYGELEEIAARYKQVAGFSLDRVR